MNLIDSLIVKFWYEGVCGTNIAETRQASLLPLCFVFVYVFQFNLFG